MFGKRISALAAAAALVISVTPMTAQAQGQDWRYGHDWHKGYDRQDDAYEGGDDDGYDRGWWHGYQSDRQRSGYDWDDDRDYDRDEDYVERGRHGELRHHPFCHRGQGTGGLVIGAVAGGLLGRQISRDRTAGAIIGGGVGALAGRALDQNGCR